MKKHLLLLALLGLLLLSGCAHPQQVATCIEGDTYGFWGGLWHGLTCPFTFMASLFFDRFTVWAVNNNGNWYTFGFLLGASAILGSGSRVTVSYR